MRTAMATDLAEMDLAEGDLWCQSPKELTVAINRIAAVSPADPHVAITADGVREILRKASAAQGELFGPEQARLWATNELLGVEFQFSMDMFVRDGRELHRLGGDLAQLASQRQLALQNDRVNAERVEHLMEQGENDEDMVRAREIAVRGMHLFTVPEFVPCSVPPPLRQSYLDAAPAVNKMMAEMWEEGKLLLLPTKQVKQVPEVVYFSPMSWALKADKKDRRVVRLGICQAHGGQP
jgi:hypothetical protein